MGKQEYKENILIPDVYLDINGVIDIMLKRGVKKDLKQISDELGYTDVAMYKLVKKAPKIVAAINYFLKENLITFEMLVKEHKTNNKTELPKEIANLKKQQKIATLEKELLNLKKELEIATLEKELLNLKKELD